MVESQTERTQGKPHLRNPPEPQSMNRLVALTVPGEKEGGRNTGVFTRLPGNRASAITPTCPCWGTSPRTRVSERAGHWKNPEMNYT